MTKPKACVLFSELSIAHRRQLLHYARFQISTEPKCNLGSIVQYKYLSVKSRQEFVELMHNTVRHIKDY